MSVDAEDSFGAMEGIKIDVHDIKTTTQLSSTFFNGI